GRRSRACAAGSGAGVGGGKVARGAWGGRRGGWPGGFRGPLRGCRRLPERLGPGVLAARDRLFVLFVHFVRREAGGRSGAFVCLLARVGAGVRVAFWLDDAAGTAEGALFFRFGLFGVRGVLSGLVRPRNAGGLFWIFGGQVGDNRLSVGVADFGLEACLLESAPRHHGFALANGPSDHVRQPPQEALHFGRFELEELGQLVARRLGLALGRGENVNYEL